MSRRQTDINKIAKNLGGTPNQSELGYVDEVLRRIGPELERRTGLVFEELVRQLIASRAIPLPFRPTYVGQWRRDGAQIDVVALDQHNALFAEVKWGRATGQDLTKLIERSQRVDVGGRRRHYLVVAR